MSVNDRVVVIAGATGVLGPTVAHEFAARGARLALLARRADELRRVSESLPGAGARHLVLPADLGSADEAAGAARDVQARLGRAEVLLHLVGTYRGGGGLAETPAADWELLLDVNLRSAVHALSAFMPQLTAGDYGRVVAVSSPYAQQPAANNAAYAAAKAALEALIMSVAGEGRGNGLTANVLVVRSIRNEPPDGSAGDRERRWTKPADIAATMLWLCSAEAAPINGARIPMHGGS